ncbi:MAG: NAD-dependent deacylase [Phycisphaerales bacterium]|nr:NAD-dependent deacylase [Phycisphaerales bacterium]
MLATSASIVAFSGAGLSAESGVPTFRDAATSGLWTRYDPARLASPEGFAADPDLVLAWYADRRRAVARATPNAAHRALAARPDIALVTQNVDDLLERAGCDPTRVVHLHGRIDRDRCHGSCGHEEPIDPAVIVAELRRCPRCGALLRPAVVWFGEALPPEAWERAVAAMHSADTVIVIGTSGAVWPAAGLVDLARSAGAGIVVVNPDADPDDNKDHADIVLRGRAGEVLPALLSGP